LSNPPTFLWRYLQGGTANINTEIQADTGGVTLPVSLSYVEGDNVPEGTPIMDNCEGYNWQFNGNSLRHGYENTGNTIGNSMSPSGFTFGYIVGGTNSNGVSSSLSFGGNAPGEAHHTNARSIQRDGTTVRYIGSPSREWANVAPTNTDPYSIILVFTNAVDSINYDPALDSTVELFINGVSQGSQSVQVTGVNGVYDDLTFFGDDGSRVQDVFIDSGAWSASKMAAYKEAWDQNQADYVDPDPNCIPV
jgi:hypothetical protein